MDVRPYQVADRDACLALLRQADLRTGFEAFLDGGPTAFFVLEHDGSVLGCGGLRDGEELVWGMIHPDWERRGLGRYLLLFRAKQCQGPALDVVTPHAYAAFYEKAGFRPVSEEPHGLRLRKKMAVCP